MWQGEKDKGANVYTPEQRVRVIVTLWTDHVGYDKSVNLPVLATKVGLPGRTLRAILSDEDGKSFIVGYAGRAGVYVVGTANEKEDAFTANLQARANSLRDRIQRRESYGRVTPFV